MTKTATTPATTTTTATTTTATIPAHDFTKDSLNALPAFDFVDDSTRTKWASDMKSHLVATGEAIYEIICSNDDELAVSVSTLESVAKAASAGTCVIRSRTNAEGKAVAEVLVRRLVPSDVPVEVRVAAVGNVDSGKSTLLGVLSSGSLDDGRGSARASVFHHPHELRTGRTSSIGHEHLAYDMAGKCLNGDKKAAVTGTVSKSVELLDLAGHAKYLKTTLFGMTGHHPDYAMLVVGSNMGFIGMTKEHLGITLALKMPAIIVVTKIDMCPPNVLADTLSQIKRVAKAPGCRKLPYVMRNMDDVVVCVRNFASEKILPIICVSNVTGENMDLLRAFLNLAPSTHRWGELVNAPLQIDVDYDWTISGVGTVVSGTVVSGTIDAHSSLVIGPDSLGMFIPINIRNIRTRTGDTDHAQAGQSITIATRRLARTSVRKGMVIVNADSVLTPCKLFQAEVLVLYHSTTIVPGYECVVHTNAVKQAARVVSMNKPLLRSGDKALVTFSFLYQPEVVLKNARIIFRDGHAKGIGRIVATTPYVSPTAGMNSSTAVTPGGVSIATLGAAKKLKTRGKRSARKMKA